MMGPLIRFCLRFITRLCGGLGRVPDQSFGPSSNNAGPGPHKAAQVRGLRDVLETAPQRNLTAGLLSYGLSASPLLRAEPIRQSQGCQRIPFPVRSTRLRPEAGIRATHT